RIVPLTYRVQNGDQLEIITGSQPQPSRDWLSPRLGYIAGARTRAKVRAWFRQLDRDQNLRQGREILERELARLNVRDVTTDTVAKQLKQKDTESLCVQLGSGEMTAAAIATAIQQLRGTQLERPTRARKARPRDSQPDGVAVSGVGDLMCNFARCCRPVPPETIAGYITQGRGVTIHRADCGNYLNLRQRHPERTIEVAWGSSETNAYPVDLSVLAYDRAGLLRDITQVLTDENVNIVELDLKTDREHMQSVIAIGIEIPDLPTLSATISRLEQLTNVVSVKRKA
ncbi:MAG: ACT domain-containing protein, partial [Pseudomonadota bacterium]